MVHPVVTVSKRSRTIFPEIIASNQDSVTLKELASGDFLLFQMLIKSCVSDLGGIYVNKNQAYFIY